MCALTQVTLVRLAVHTWGMGAGSLLSFLPFVLSLLGGTGRWGEQSTLRFTVAGLGHDVILVEF